MNRGERDMSLLYGIGYFVLILAELFLNSCLYAVLLEEFSSSARCLDIEAEVVEASDKRKRLLLVLVCDCYKHRAVILHVHARCLKRLVECAVEVVIVADSLTCGFHLG